MKKIAQIHFHSAQLDPLPQLPMTSKEELTATNKEPKTSTKQVSKPKLDKTAQGFCFQMSKPNPNM